MRTTFDLPDKLFLKVKTSAASTDNDLEPDDAVYPFWIEHPDATKSSILGAHANTRCHSQDCRAAADARTSSEQIVPV